MTTKCKWETYGNYCGSEFINSDGFCSEHAEEKCGNCGMKATQGCCCCGQFVCGMPCCEKCGHCSVDHGAKKERSIPKLPKIDDFKHLNKKELLVELERYLRRDNAVVIEKWKESLK